ncbi:MAG: exodeoxyribonuclease VII small subunit [Clostridia bacterium]|nr:exodeoxyribonuclease VII small subunit [Clostridia bacterium]
MAERKTAKQAAEPMKLEDAMRRLDEVVLALDNDAVELEQGMKLYEEGVRLVRICNEKLGEAERTVRVLKMNRDGEITEEPFAEE